MIDSDIIRYQKTTAQFMFDNYMPMLSDHFAEAEHSTPDKNINLNKEVLLKMESMGKLFVLVAIDQTIDIAVGYVAFIIDDSYLTDVKVANELGLYVIPVYRNYGIAARLLLTAEMFLKEQNVDVIKMVLKDKNRGMHSQIFDLGYDLEELVFYKRI